MRIVLQTLVNSWKRYMVDHAYDLPDRRLEMLADQPGS